ncbi:hypothetical protein D9M68_853780 [compost metagenome]
MPRRKVLAVLLITVILASPGACSEPVDEPTRRSANTEILPSRANVSSTSTVKAIGEVLLVDAVAAVWVLLTKLVVRLASRPRIWSSDPVVLEVADRVVIAVPLAVT